MRPEPSKERPSWLADDEPYETHTPEVLGHTLEPDAYVNSDAPPERSMLEAFGPVLPIGGAIITGALLAVGGALYTKANQPEPAPHENVSSDPGNAEGSIPVHKGIKKGTDRFGR